MTTRPSFGSGHGHGAASATSTSRIRSFPPRRPACSPCSTTGCCWTSAGRKRRSRPPTGRSLRRTCCTRQAIVTELISSLKRDAWDGADGLLGLYNYVSTALINANIQRDAALTREAIELLEPLRQAWHEAAAPFPACPGGPACRDRRPPPAFAAPAPGTPSLEPAAGALALGDRPDMETG